MDFYHPNYMTGRPVKCASPSTCPEGPHANDFMGCIRIYEEWLAGQMKRTGQYDIPSWTKKRRPPRGS